MPQKFAHSEFLHIIQLFKVVCERMAKRMERAEGWLEHPVGLSVLRSKGVYRYIQTYRNTQNKGV